MSQLTEEEKLQLDEKAVELAKKYGVQKVYVYVAIDPVTDERIIGYLKEPSYIQKIMAMDKIATVGPFMAGEEMRGVLTLKEESDSRTFEEVAAYDSYRIGMATEAMRMIEVVENSYKKK
jgi:uncharacterized protein YciI